jgi:hypothetical protein
MRQCFGERRGAVLRVREANDFPSELMSLGSAIQRASLPCAQRRMSEVAAEKVRGHLMLFSEEVVVPMEPKAEKQRSLGTSTDEELA